MERVERTNTVMVYLNQWSKSMPWYNLYAIEVDWENKNCYNCIRFGYITEETKIMRREEWLKENRII